MASSYETIRDTPKFRELVRRRSSLAWRLAAAMLIIYFGFILLVGYAPKLLGVAIGGGVITVGIPIGLAVIVSAFALTGFYVHRANSEYDPLIRQIVEEAAQ